MSERGLEDRRVARRVARAAPRGVLPVRVIVIRPPSDRHPVRGQTPWTLRVDLVPGTGGQEEQHADRGEQR